MAVFTSFGAKLCSTIESTCFAVICLLSAESTGIVSTIAGNGVDASSGDGGKALNAQVSEPYAIAVDASNNIYVVEYPDPAASSSGSCAGGKDAEY